MNWGPTGTARDMLTFDPEGLSCAQREGDACVVCHKKWPRPRIRVGPPSRRRGRAGLRRLRRGARSHADGHRGRLPRTLSGGGRRAKGRAHGTTRARRLGRGAARPRRRPRGSARASRTRSAGPGTAPRRTPPGPSTPVPFQTPLASSSSATTGVHGGLPDDGLRAVLAHRPVVVDHVVQVDLARLAVLAGALHPRAGARLAAASGRPAWPVGQAGRHHVAGRHVGTADPDLARRCPARACAGS